MTVYPVGALLFIFIARFYSFIFPFLLPAIGKNLKVKKCFSFCFEVFFLSRKRKESESYGHRKRRKAQTRQNTSFLFAGVCDYLFFTGRRLNHQPTTESQKESE